MLWRLHEMIHVSPQHSAWHNKSSINASFYYHVLSQEKNHTKIFLKSQGTNSWNRSDTPEGKWCQQWGLQHSELIWKTKEHQRKGTKCALPSGVGDAWRKQAKEEIKGFGKKPVWPWPKNSEKNNSITHKAESIIEFSVWDGENQSTLLI